MPNYFTNNGVPVLSLRTPTMTAKDAKAAGLSPRALSRAQFDSVILETQKGDIIIIEDSIRATSIIVNHKAGDCQYTVHWHTSSGKPKKDVIVLRERETGKLSVVKGDEATKILKGEIPEGFEVEFIAPKRQKKSK